MEDTKAKYQRCKQKVKLWEDEFMKQNDRLPSKVREMEHNFQNEIFYKCFSLSFQDDIKNASASVRYSYKNYHSLKRELSTKENNKTAASKEDALLSSVHDSLTVLFADEPNISPPDPKAKERGTKKTQILPVFNSSGKLTELTAQMDAMKKKRQRTSPENKTAAPDSPAPVVQNVDKVWGEHLNGSVRKLNQRTASFQFAEKLFTSATFKSKRNPLLPHTPLRRTKSEVFSEFVTALSTKKIEEPKTEDANSLELNQEANADIEDGIPTDVGPADDVLEDMETGAASQDSPAVALEMFATKCKFKVKDSLRVQASSNMVASKITSNMDERWIERCAKPNKVVESSQESVPSKMPRNESSSSLQSSYAPDSQHSVTVGISACTLDSQSSMVRVKIILFLL
jgi:hypothetical protein